MFNLEGNDSDNVLDDVLEHAGNDGGQNGCLTKSNHRQLNAH